MAVVVVRRPLHVFSEQSLGLGACTCGWVDTHRRMELESHLQWLEHLKSLPPRFRYDVR